MRTELQNVRTDIAAVASIASRGVTRNTGRGSIFSRSLAEAAKDMAASDQTVSRPANAVSRYLRTAPLSGEDSVRTARTSNGKTGPLNSAAEPSNPAVPAVPEMQAYFLTHAPGEWSLNPEARAKFVEIYGETALVTLDWLGTVPENTDPTWVTKVAVDATGRPYPKVRQQKEQS